MIEPKPPPLTISEYLLYLKSKDVDEHKYLHLEWILNNLKPMLQYFNESIGIQKDIPELKIIFQGLISPISTTGMIYLDESFIEFCFNLKFKQLEFVTLDEHLIQTFNYSWMPYIFIQWAVAHEYMHIVRHDSEEIKEHKEHEKISKATEHDADLFAITHIYRHFSEQVSGLFNPKQIKFLVIYSVFWGLRVLPEDRESLSHPQFKERLERMIWRLGALRDLGQPPDFNLENEISREVTTELFKAFVNMETSFIWNETGFDLANSWLFPLGLQTSPDEIDKILVDLNPILKRNLYS